MCTWYTEGIGRGCSCLYLRLNLKRPVGSCGRGAPGSWAGLEVSSDQQFCVPTAHSQGAGALCRSISSPVPAAGVSGCREKGLAWEEGERQILPCHFLGQGVGETRQLSKEKLKFGLVLWLGRIWTLGRDASFIPFRNCRQADVHGGFLVLPDSEQWRWGGDRVSKKNP